MPEIPKSKTEMSITVEISEREIVWSFHPGGRDRDAVEKDGGLLLRAKIFFAQLVHQLLIGSKMKDFAVKVNIVHGYSYEVTLSFPL
jgi:hypothetical protein